MLSASKRARRVLEVLVSKIFEGSGLLGKLSGVLGETVLGSTLSQDL
jgi:hypothetical protein